MMLLTHQPKDTYLELSYFPGSGEAKRTEVVIKLGVKHGFPIPSYQIHDPELITLKL